MPRAVCLCCRVWGQDETSHFAQRLSKNAVKHFLRRPSCVLQQMATILALGLVGFKAKCYPPQKKRGGRSLITVTMFEFYLETIRMGPGVVHRFGRSW